MVSKIEVLILKTLRNDGPKLTGSEIRKATNMQLKKGSCYTILMRLKEKGWIKTGGNMYFTIYTITKEGIREIKKWDREHRILLEL